MTSKLLYYKTQLYRTCLECIKKEKEKKWKNLKFRDLTKDFIFIYKKNFIETKAEPKQLKEQGTRSRPRG